MRPLLLSAVLLAACSRREAKVGPDLVDAAPPTDGSVAEAPLERFMVGARIVDVPSRSIAHELQKKPPLFAEVDHERAYVVHEGVVHAYDSKTAVEVWKATPPACRHFAMTEHVLYCAGDNDLHALAKTDGSLRTIASTRPLGQMLGLARHLIVLRGGSEVESLAEGDSAPLATIKASLHSYRGLVRQGDGFCGAAGSVKGGVFAGCWTATLKEKWSKAIVIAKPGDPTLSSYDVRRLGHGFLVAGSNPWSSSPLERSVVVRLSDGDELARVDETLVAVGARNEREIDGLVSLKKGIRYLAPNGSVRWSAKVFVDDSAEALLDGDRLLVATYPQISSGATLYALDRTTGALLWKHVPPMPPIAHSAYINEVDLSIVANTLVMRGHEAGVEYASLVDRATGAAQLNTMLPLWGP